MPSKRFETGLDLNRFTCGQFQCSLKPTYVIMMDTIKTDCKTDPKFYVWTQLSWFLNHFDPNWFVV